MSHGYRRIYRDEAGRTFAQGPVVFGERPTPRGVVGVHGRNTNMSWGDNLGLSLVQDDVGEMDYASLGYYDFGEDEYDEFGSMDYPSLGAQGNRYVPRGSSSRQRPASAQRRAPQVVQKTIVTGSSGANPGAGSNSVTIRPQFDFVAEDCTFQGSVGTWTILSIDFGDRRVFNNATGVPIAVFATASFTRGLIKGAAIAAGLDITITGNLTTSTTTSELVVTIIGLKRGTSGCGPGAV